MAENESRRYERIEIELPCRLYVLGPDNELRFEAFCKSLNLGLGGVFVGSSFLLREGLRLCTELALPNGPLTIQSRVAYVVSLDHEQFHAGMGIEFLDVDAHGRETLLRYFTPVRYQTFYDTFVRDFPHLGAGVPLSDVSLILNLWEEWKIRAEEGASVAPSGEPRSLPRVGNARSPGSPRSRGRGRA